MSESQIINRGWCPILSVASIQKDGQAEPCLGNTCGLWVGLGDDGPAACSLTMLGMSNAHLGRLVTRLVVVLEQMAEMLDGGLSVRKL